MRWTGLAAVVLLAVAGGIVSYRRATVAAPSGSRAAPEGSSSAAAPTAPAARAAPAPGPDAAAPVSPGTAAGAADARLAARLGLAPPAPSSTADALAHHDRDELALFADLQRRTGHPAPPAVRELVELRRSGADEAELERLAKERLAGDPLARATVLRWLARRRAEASGAGAAPAPAARPVGRPPAVAPLVPR